MIPRVPLDIKIPFYLFFYHPIGGVNAKPLSKQTTEFKKTTIVNVKISFISVFKMVISDRVGPSAADV